ncbi:MAG: FAD-dependent thymidylate synthase [Alphaproteobacteria bacterium]|nr:FAD-dependent thymidylate synthase [Alphaproteobacteria bacterium]MBT5390367.1 FAD-dependent thymidylate synthase [Alphaproteobacteria bacterium]MBT5540232.1 FAD-dependent thymidylate synthase [Alphaproteobacteria bacterium]
MLTDDQKAGIEEQRTTEFKTRRATVPTLEDILYTAFPVLDHGFVRVVDYMGDDQAVVQAARVSYGRGTKKVSEDKGLINYLMRHRHSTPFEMCEIKFHVKLPFFVARHWIRHRTANVNEYSARYSILDNEFYIPAPDQLAAQATENRQGRGRVLTGAESEKILKMLKEDALQSYEHYGEMLNVDDQGVVKDPENSGLARELARMNLSLNFYTQWYWKVDLHNLMHFLSLRCSEFAQYEIRVYAQEMIKMLKKWVPHTYEAFVQHRLEGAGLSRGGLEAVKKLIRGQNVSREDVGLTAREWRELTDLLEMDLENPQKVA